MTTALALRAPRASFDGPDPGEAATLSAERLAKAKICPATGLATEYLNHFNEPAGQYAVAALFGR